MFFLLLLCFRFRFEGTEDFADLRFEWRQEGDEGGGGG